MIAEKYEAYLRNEKCMAERSVHDYLKIALEMTARFDCGNGLTYKQINDAIAEKKEREGLSQGTTYKYSICVRHFFKWLHREGLRLDNPYPYADWKKPRLAIPKFLTTDQFKALLDDPLLSRQEMALLWLLWDSGARIGEIAQMTQANVDLIKKIVHVPYQISKGHYSHRSIPVSDQCADSLLTQFATLQRAGLKDCLFISHGNRPMTKGGLHKRVKAIGARKSLFRNEMRLSCHMFRHSCAIRWLEAGVPQVIVQKWLGHQTLQMTSHYVNLCEESSRRIYDQHCRQPSVL